MKILIEMDSRISDNVSWNEVVRSQTATRQGIENKPNFRQMVVIKHLAKDFFQPLRLNMGVPLKINSFYRSKQLNKMIGGSKTSDHMVTSDVAAIDIDDSYSQKLGVYNRDIFLYILRNMDYYKLIWEYDDHPTVKGLSSPRWVHVSYSTDPIKNKQKTTLFTNGNGYTPFKLDLI